MDKKVIQIDIEVHKMLKDYCDREGLRMGHAATKMIKEIGRASCRERV